MADPLFAIRMSTSGEYYFYLRAANGEIIATSEMYTSKQGARNGIESVKKNAATALTIDMTEDGA